MLVYLFAQLKYLFLLSTVKSNENMVELDFILAGSGAIHGLLLLLFQPTEETMNETVQKEYEGFMKLREGKSTSHRTKEIIQFIADDKFEEGVYKDSLNWSYLSTLKNLKEEFVSFYFKKLSDLENENLDMDNVADLDARISEYVIQLMRLRLDWQMESIWFSPCCSKTIRNYTRAKKISVSGWSEYMTHSKEEIQIT